MSNFGLAALYIVVNVYQFVLLPVLLLPIYSACAWTILSFALYRNTYWSVFNETILDLFHPNRNVNGFFGRFLSILFGAPFRILRMSHLVHHKLNRRPAEGTEYYDRAKSTKARAAPGYFFQILIGLYLVEVLSPGYFLLPRRLLVWAQKRFVRADGVSGLLMQNWLAAEALREIRFDGLLTVSWLALSFVCYGSRWPVLAAVLLARAFLISFLDNVYHYATPVDGVFYARNLRLPAAGAKLLLNFNLHGVHHINPAIPWIDLPEAFDVEGGKYHGEYFAAAVSQLRGPIALQDLPRGAPALRIRPF
jgi:fatty acid desaturase